MNLNVICGTGGSVKYEEVVSRFLNGDAQEVLASIDGSNPDNAELLSELLLAATVSEDSEKIRLLLAHGASASLVVEGQSFNAMDHALFAKNTEIIQLYLEQGVDRNILREYLSKAVFAGDEEQVRFLCQPGVEANRGDVDTKTEGSALYYALSQRKWKCAVALIELGSDVKSLNTRRGENILLTEVLCISWDEQRELQEQLVRLCVERGYPVNRRGPCRWTLLHEAVRWYSFDLVKFLVEHGAGIEIKDSKGDTPLDYASGDTKAYLLGQLAGG